MAQKKSTQTRRRAEKKQATWNFPLRRDNFIWLGISVGVIIVGYILLSLGISEEAATIEGTWNNSISVTIAPIVLVIGYCILLPYSILKGNRITKDKYTLAEQNTEPRTATEPTSPGQ